MNDLVKGAAFILQFIEPYLFLLEMLDKWLYWYNLYFHLIFFDDWVLCFQNEFLLNNLQILEKFNDVDVDERCAEHAHELVVVVGYVLYFDF